MAGLEHRQIRYAVESELQIVDVWELPKSERTAAATSDRYWFIYVHGGAWRDPRCLTDTAVPAINRLLAEDSPYMSRRRIAGFASIGYRLSPHPEFPQDPKTTPLEKLRAAKHPDHIDDVRTGLAALAREGLSAAGSPADYIAHDRYIVYGHSCGAFLAFQLWMGNLGDKTLPCVVGLEGIYDLRGLVERGGNPAHGGGPRTGFASALEAIAEGAFGRDRGLWDTASPGQYDFSTLAEATKPRLALVAYSDEDELVDGGEMDTMEKTLQQGVAKSNGQLRYVGLRDLHGRHDEVHEDGREVARVLTEAVRQLDRLS
ncbi:uncharacterized protein SPSK_09550 [Sporothrix schenckii 1099-18]|uniref:Kynurenine formamidase n=1 Tax=Sporothrix schenckii 1099-18 TaxID=1397361 RepID=A0A0F2M7K6_SPOSC|nr:uncharacterized protein SPSK_09550 [Sporothrix schenckii 1099-18]KJR84810.1 hypothetical protein SPSK_09550 [Sporothrix schenckii 1099-18]